MLLNEKPRFRSTGRRLWLLTICGLFFGLAAVFGTVRLTTATEVLLPEEQNTVAPTTSDVAAPEKAPPALDAETEKLLALAESMVTLPDITVERLRDLYHDLYSKMYLFPYKFDVFYERLTGILDKMYLLEPTDEILGLATSWKFSMLENMALRTPTDETIRALEEFASEVKHSQNQVVTQYERILDNVVLKAKWFFLISPEVQPTADQFLEIKARMIDIIKEDGRWMSQVFRMDDITKVTSQLYEKNVVTREQMLEMFTSILAALNESPQEEETMQRVRDGVEIRLAFLQAEGKTPEITGTDMNGKPFDWNTFKGKTVLMTFTSTTWYGDREMLDMLELSEEFGEHGLEWVTYVALNGKESDDHGTENEQWLERCVNRLNYPGTVLTQFQSSDAAIGTIPDWLGQWRYSSVFPPLMLLDQEGKIVAMEGKTKMREKLSELFGKPSEAAIARGQEHSKVYRTVPKPCTVNLKELALAVHVYHDARKSFPPAYTMDDKGNKLHSWRVLLLPYLGYEELYSQIRLDEPWNSEYNKQFNDVIVPVFQCHETAFADNPKPITTYAAIVGRQGVFEENGKQISFFDIRDGSSNTLLFVERATPVNWMDPTDITFEEAIKGVGVSPNGIADTHGGSNCAICDGGTTFMSKNIKPEVLRASITRNGGEIVPFVEGKGIILSEEQ